MTDGHGYPLVVPVTFGHPWRSCCFCLEKCPRLWLLVVSLGGLQRPEHRARHRRSSRAEIIPGPVSLNGGPRHRRSGLGGAATRALRLVTDPARRPAGPSLRVSGRACRLSVTDPSPVTDVVGTRCIMHPSSSPPPRLVLPIAHSGSLPRRPPPLLRIFHSDSLTCGKKSKNSERKKIVPTNPDLFSLLGMSNSAHRSESKESCCNFDLNR